VCGGLIAGAALAYWGRRLAASLIQESPMTSASPVTCGAIAMVALAVIAAYVPARRATRVEPLEALRHE
jgi:ABC-type antimicrobial peptide transport system permease subunit